ncbi:hypothetical protein OT109_07155 [Phycisphaeraceae bacterium D3-23]
MKSALRLFLLAALVLYATASASWAQPDGRGRSQAYAAALAAYERATGIVRERYQRGTDLAQTRFTRTVEREHGRYLRALDRMADKLERDDEDALAAVIRAQHRAASAWELDPPGADGACFLDTILVDVEGSEEASQLGVDFLVVATEAKLECVEDLVPLVEAYHEEMWDAMQSQRDRMERFGYDDRGRPHDELVRFRRKLFEMGDLTAGGEAFSGQVLLLTGDHAPPGEGTGRAIRLKYHFRARGAYIIEANWGFAFNEVAGQDMVFEWTPMAEGRGVIMRYDHGRGDDIKPCVAEWYCAEGGLWPMRVLLWWDASDYENGALPDDTGVAQVIGRPIEDVTPIATNRGHPSFDVLMQETVGPSGQHSGEVLWYRFRFQGLDVKVNSFGRYPGSRRGVWLDCGPMIVEQDGFIMTLRRDPWESPEHREVFRVDYTDLHHPVVELWYTYEAYEAGESPHAVNLGDITYAYRQRGDGPEEMRRMTQEDLLRR